MHFAAGEVGWGQVSGVARFPCGLLGAGLLRVFAVDWKYRARYAFKVNAKPTAPSGEPVRSVAEPAPGAPEGVKGGESFQFWSSGALARSERQQKCVEMSLTVTVGLGAAFAVLGEGVVKGKGTDTHTAFALVLLLYATIQTLILANYVFQTLQVVLCNVHIGFLREKLDTQVNTRIVEKLPNRTGFCWRWGLRLGEGLQPLVIYFSVFCGWVGAALYCWFCAWPNISGWWSMLFVIPLIGFVVLGIMHRCHEDLGKWWVTRDSKKCLDPTKAA